MEQCGWLSSEWALSEINRRAKFYKLTAAGRKQLALEEKSWDQLMKGVQTMLRFA
jgi:DNA-binding PadR family transcriptional regulator